MAANVINWSSLFHGAVLTLDLYDAVSNPNGDVLRFDDPTISAYDLFLAANDDLTLVSITDLFTGKTVWFNVDGLTVTTSNITFAGGSVLLVGDNNFGTANDNAGNTLVGGSGHDQLVGLGGNDRLLGGAGWDVFIDGYGNNTLVGANGNDWFDVWSEMGSANTVTGGLGQDFYYLDDESASLLAPPGSPGHNYRVTDFTPGAGGDIIYTSDLVYIAIGYFDQDPFAAGFLRLVQSGANTLYQGDRDGAAGTTYTWMTLITLQNVSLGSLTPANFPDLVVGTNGNDLLTGTEKDERNDGNDLMPGLLGNDTLQGVSGDDYLTGAEGHDVLNGGAGKDSMYGGLGRDRYYVDDRDDTVIETSNASALAAAGSPSDPNPALSDIIDTVIAVVTYSLQQVDFVENLTLKSAATHGTGNDLANVLTGNGLHNRLTGLGGNDTFNGSGGSDTLLGQGGIDVLRGGTGKDTLTGGTGADTFDFNTALNASTNVDRITDFTTADVMQLDNDFFTGLAAGALAGSRFYKAVGATQANDASDRIVYNTTNGNLYFDADGMGGTPSTLFATLATHPGISSVDFFIVN